MMRKCTADSLASCFRHTESGVNSAKTYLETLPLCLEVATLGWLSTGTKGQSAWSGTLTLTLTSCELLDKLLSFMP